MYIRDTEYGTALSKASTRRMVRTTLRMSSYAKASAGTRATMPGSAVARCRMASAVKNEIRCVETLRRYSVRSTECRLGCVALHLFSTFLFGISTVVSCTVYDPGPGRSPPSLPAYVQSTKYSVLPSGGQKTPTLLRV